MRIFYASLFIPVSQSATKNEDYHSSSAAGENEVWVVKKHTAVHRLNLGKDGGTLLLLLPVYCLL